MLRRHAPHVLVIMQTVFEDDEKIFTAIRAGAHGCLLKKSSPSKFIEGIGDVAEGGAPMSASIARKIIEAFRQQKSDNNFAPTAREQETLSTLTRGMSYKMIADACGVTFNTVNAQCKKIYEKLHVHSATEAVAKATNRRII
jgi:DNA-binding NarL/FixJ family response regulator